MRRGLLLLFLIIIDLLSKEFFESRRLVFYNQGISFSMGSGSYLPLLSLVLSLFFLLLWMCLPRKWGLTILLAGAWGNTIDRFWFGAVRDFITYPVIGISGNLADLYLIIGAGLMVWEEYNTRNEK